MIEARINDILLQMQAIGDRATGQISLMDERAGSSAATANFGSLMKASVNAVNDVQQHAGGLVQSFELGDPNVEVSEVMVALQKADISFKAMTEVRNRLVDAYQEIMNMPV